MIYHDKMDSQFSLSVFPLVVFCIFSLINSQQIEDLPTYTVNATSTKKAGSSKTLKDLLDIFDNKLSPRIGFPLKDDNQNETFLKIPKNAFFADMNPDFMHPTMEFQNMLMKKNSVKDILALASVYKQRTHHHLWLQGLIGALLNKDVPVNFLPLIEFLPDLFVPFTQILENILRPINPTLENKCILTLNEEIGKQNGVENKLWYFREDVMVNSHHWYWHLEFPVNASQDRQGELFYYMHHSILARYHAERLSNDMAPVRPLNIARGQRIREPYYTYLRDSNSGQNWASRPPFTSLQDVVIKSLNIPIDEFKLHERRLNRAATTGIMFAKSINTPLSIKNSEGIDIISKAAEATVGSVNPQYYGQSGWHNDGHLLVAFVTEPYNPQENPVYGVIGDTATAMRDVVFYRWHSTVNNLFRKHKSTLTPYQPYGGELALAWPGISVETIAVNTVGRRSNPPVNTLYTFWNERSIELSKGLDFIMFNKTGTSVNVCIQHLTHDDFTYEITVIKRPFVTATTATIRIFMAPRFNENGVRYTMQEQRNLFFVMDTFQVSLKIGRNIISRRSIDSSLTLPFTSSVDQLNSGNEDWCGCGWPHHLLLPKGKQSGMTFDLFVMVTNGEDDAVPQTPFGNPNSCNQGYLFCSTLHGLYPDSKPMGYPFDRNVFPVVDLDHSGPNSNVIRPVANLEEYISYIPNMNAVQVTIFHEADRKETIPSSNNSGR